MVTWTAEQRAAAAAALAQHRCPGCDMKGQVVYVGVGPLRWKTLHCMACEELYSLAPGFWEWIFTHVFSRFWNGHVYCEGHK